MPEKKTQKREREYKPIRPEGAMGQYANHVSSRITPWDIELSFGQIREADEERLVYDEVARIYLSPQHAKAVLALLQKQIDSYELEHGAVSVPPGHFRSEPAR
jgi:hypothetical protein